MYVISYKKQLERINEMIPLRKDERTFEVFYHDPNSGKLWKSFFPHFPYIKNGPKLLRPEPLPSSIEHQLELCINSGNKADAIGLGIEYSLQPEKWPEIFEILEKNRKSYIRSGFFSFLDSLGTKNPEESPISVQKRFDLSEEKLTDFKKRTKKLYLRRFLGV